MSEQTEMSITVTVAPRIAGGLAALAGKHLPEPAPREPAKARPSIYNRSEGTVTGTLFQIGTVNNVNVREGR